MNLLTRLMREPALLIGAIAATVDLAVAFGLHLSAEQVGAVNALAAALGALWLRGRVTPVPRKTKARRRG